MSSIPENPVSTWSEYYQATLAKPLHPLFLELEPYLPSAGNAVDLGCGVGHAVVWLAEKGWQVLAVDGHEEALSIVESRLSNVAQKRVSLTCSRLEDVELPSEAFDLVVAAYSLFFIESKATLNRLWSDIHTALKPGGLVLFELLGPQDDWAGDFLTHDRDEVDQFLKGWDVLHLEEAEQDGQTSQGTTKHWHVYHVIARKS